MLLCEQNCIFLDYNIETQKVTCKCEVKNSFSPLIELTNKNNYLLFYLDERQPEAEVVISSTIISTESLTSFIEAPTEARTIITTNNIAEAQTIKATLVEEPNESPYWFPFFLKY